MFLDFNNDGKFDGLDLVILDTLLDEKENEQGDEKETEEE